MSFQKRFGYRWVSLPAALLVALLWLAPTAYAVEPDPLNVQAPRQLFSGDLKVERGQVIAENVVVYSGDVEIEEGGSINGTLVVMSGDIEIDRGGNVEGDVTAYSGDIKIEGRVGGKVSALSGNIELGDQARVEGDLSVLSGRIRRAEGAYVGGNFVQTPGFRVPGVPELPDQPMSVAAPRSSLLGQFLGLLARLVGAIVLTGLVAAIAGVITSVWPAQVARTRTTLEAQRPLSFVVGLFGNLTLLFSVGLLSITVCLLPLALVPLLALLAVNLVGWTVASQIVGERVVVALKQEVQPVLTVAVGAVLLTGIASLLWAFGGCFRPIGFLYVLGVASFGTGAVVVPWLNRRSGRANAAGAEETASTTAQMAEMQPMAEVGAEPVDEVQTEPPVAFDELAPEEWAPDAQPAEAQSGDVEDQFTRMRGVGPTIETKLKAAGFRSFAQLAAASAEEIAEVLGWSVERVQRSELREQAQRLAEDV